MLVILLPKRYNS